ncbi:2247_t:CDS:2, partial [Gigaspora margarita]
VQSFEETQGRRKRTHCDSPKTQDMGPAQVRNHRGRIKRSRRLRNQESGQDHLRSRNQAEFAGFQHCSKHNAMQKRVR